MGGCLMGMYLTGVYLMSVCLLAVYLMSVHLISMHLTPAMSVNRLSLQLFNNYNAAPNPAAVSAIQLQVINACVPANFTNHANEVFTPLGCPGFGIKARYLRCQAMFHYNSNVAPNLVNLERAWRSRQAPLMSEEGRASHRDTLHRYTPHRRVSHSRVPHGRVPQDFPQSFKPGPLHGSEVDEDERDDRTKSEVLTVNLAGAFIRLALLEAKKAFQHIDDNNQPVVSDTNWSQYTCEALTAFLDNPDQDEYI
jgi:hypothetical protein